MCEPVIEHTNIAKRGIKILREEGVVEFAKRFLRWFLRCMKKQSRILLLPYALLKIKSFRRDYDLNKLISFAFDGLGGLIKPLQVRNEILELLRILDEIKPKVVIEIGTAGGGTLFLFCHVASEDATIISIDFPDRKFGGGYLGWKVPLYKAFSLPKQKLHLIRADSHNQETLERVKNILNGRKVDFVFIDGDHTYEGVKRDFEMFTPLVKEGGITAFHDVLVHPAEQSCEVSKFWNEIKEEKYKCAEIVTDWNRDWGGIGLLFMNFKR